MPRNGNEAVIAIIDKLVDGRQQWLADRGAFIDIGDGVLRDSESLEKYLQKENINIPEDELTSMWTVLGDECIVGTDVNDTDRSGRTALHRAGEFGNTEIIPLLLQYDADITAEDNAGMTALHVAAMYNNSKAVELLLIGGADIDAVGLFGETALYLAARSGFVEIVEVLLDRQAKINTDDEDTSVLSLAIVSGELETVALLYERGIDVRLTKTANQRQNTLVRVVESVLLNLREKVAISRILISKGSIPAKLLLSEKECLEHYQLGLVECCNVWRQCFDEQKSLAEIPLEVIQDGEYAVSIYCADLSGEPVYRSKVCIVGPTTWGKSSLIKSICDEVSSPVDISDRTIGIDLFPLRLKASGAVHEVTFWDFAGQDIYKVAHALFFSKRTLYFVCLDLQVYAQTLKKKGFLSKNERDSFVSCFFEESVLRWIRLIQLSHPDARFKMIGTKVDCISTEELELIRKDVDIQLCMFLEELKASEKITSDVWNALDTEFQQLEATSIKTELWIDQARQFVKGVIFENPEWGFRMPPQYSKFLTHIFAKRAEVAKATPERRVEKLITKVADLHGEFTQLYPDFKLNMRECMKILSALHEIGDILWYQHHTEVFQKWIILDPIIVLDIVREVINHNYEGKSGDGYDALRRDGTLQHSLLKTFPHWKALEEADSDLVYFFKHLLHHYDLAYPADKSKSLHNDDLIVPTYWRPTESIIDSSRHLHRHPSKLSQNDIYGKAIAKWEYVLPVSVSEAIFKKFAVRCYRKNVIRNVEATLLESFVPGEFAAAMYFTPNKAEITLLVVAQTQEMAWEEMRYLVMTMEQVLQEYKGLESAGYGQNQSEKIQRHIITVCDDSADLDHGVNHLHQAAKDEERFRKDNPWLPPDFGWFINRVWKHDGKLGEMLERTRISRHLNSLKLLIVNGEKRRYPAVWTLWYLHDGSGVHLRLHSDVSGICYHNPIEIKIPAGSDFVAHHPNIVKGAISLISVASGAIPLPVAGAAVNEALSELKVQINRGQAITDTLERAGVVKGNATLSTDMDMSPKDRLGFLHKLLSFHDPPYDEYTIGGIANLRCVVTNEGSYVWADKDEIKKLRDHIPLCEPVAPITPMGASQLFFSFHISSVTGFELDYRKRVYCHWDLVHRSRPSSTQRGKAEKRQAEAGKVCWGSSRENYKKLSIDFLAGCFVNIRVKRTHMFRRHGIELGTGELQLQPHISGDGNSPKSIKIEIPLTQSTIPSLRVACEINIDPVGTTGA